MSLATVHADMSADTHDVFVGAVHPGPDVPRPGRAVRAHGAGRLPAGRVALARPSARLEEEGLK
jgi:hypothetical protein